MLLILAALTALVFFLVLGRFRDYQRPFPYELPFTESDTLFSPFEMQTGRPFSDGLVVSDNRYHDEDITLTSNKERLLLFDLTAKKPILATDIFEQSFPASLTKLMTAYLVLEKGNPEDMVTMQEEDFPSVEGAQESGLKAGDQINVEQLLRIVMVYSGNDAAEALARYVAGSADAFVGMMNEQAAKLGMTGTRFTNVTGLHDEGHYSTPYDIYLMMQAILSDHPALTEMSQLPQVTVNYTAANGEKAVRTLYATDEYLTGIYSLPEGLHILLSKTGTTDEAGACLSLILEDGKGNLYCAIIMGAGDHTLLYRDMNLLLQKIN